MGALVDQAELVAFCARNGEPGLAALELARFEYPHLEPATYLSRLDDMAARVEMPTHLGLRRVLAIAEGIGGNVEDYYAPDNGFLHRVLDTRKGSPIVLSVIWMEVGRRVGRGRRCRASRTLRRVRRRADGRPLPLRRGHRI